MLVLKGVAVSGGIAIGEAYTLPPALLVVEHTVAGDQVLEELVRLERAFAAADAQLGHILGRLQVGRAPEAHAIIEAHRYMLGSADLIEEARQLVRRRGLSAESAVRRALDRIKGLLEGATEPHLRERGNDIDAIADRLLRILLRLPESRPAAAAPEGSVAVGVEVTPLDVIELKRAGVKGIVTRAGGRASHAAILARSFGIAWVLGVDAAIERVPSGLTIAVDGRRGEVTIDPDHHAQRLLRGRETAERARTEKLQAVRGPAITGDGTAIHLAVNLGSFQEIQTGLDMGAESVGLFRTELAYLDRPELPSEQEQAADAGAAVRAMAGRSVTFRTLDVGADKLPASVQIRRSENPALGLRSIRFSLKRRDIFHTQLRALYRASAEGPVRIMFPLVTGMSELRAAGAACADVRAELTREQIAHDAVVPIGIMVETPSAALMVDRLAGQCDFFSIGTNDLVQYLLAAGREDEDVGYLYRPLEPAVLRVVAQVVAAASAAGKPVAVCGDMAGDPAVTWILLGLGIRSLSMAPSNLPAVRSVIRATRLADAQELTARALALDCGEAIEELVMQTMAARFPVEMAI